MARPPAGRRSGSGSDQDGRPGPPGKVYLVGAGPGDPGLITLKGMECIRKADVVLYDALIPQSLLAGAPPHAKLVYVGKRSGPGPRVQEKRQQTAENLMIRHARRGGTVVRLKGGDPFVFGRGGEEAETLRRHRIPVEFVPGVTSAIAAPAAAGIPVTHRQHASSVLFLTGHEDGGKPLSHQHLRMLAGFDGTLVLLMALRALPDLVKDLIEAGKSPDTPSAAIQWGTTPMQKSAFAPLGRLPAEVSRMGIGRPCVIVIGPVTRLATRLRWLESKPLFGKTILVTRPMDQSTALMASLEDAGARVLACPTIRIEPLAIGAALRQAFRSLDKYNYIIFTSANGVRLFFDRLAKSKRDIRDLHRAHTVAIGPETAKALQSTGIHTDVLADDFIAEGILSKLKGPHIAGSRILIPRAIEAREVLPETLRRRGARVDIVPLYRAIPEPGLRSRIRGIFDTESIDCVTFTSSSTATHFFTHAPPSLLTRRPRFLAGSIGPITTRTIRSHYSGPILTASVHTAQGLVDALIRRFRKRRP
ncbi:MAG: uroporphyrinogen-III C-methyltransferase [Nitrospirae bacterium]|nr:uroporphyrinogen-III C-methyltransferase [Nitrospirota bacterium]